MENSRENKIEQFEDTIDLEKVLKIAQILNAETEDLDNNGIID